MRRVIESAFESHWTFIDGRRMHARFCCRVPERPIVMLHGLVVSSAYLMPTATRLATVAPVWLPELPGAGKSEPPARTLDIDDSAIVLKRWLEAVGLRRPLLFANSFGCQVAAALAERWPDSVAGLVLTSPTLERSGRTFMRPILRWLHNAPHEPLSLLPIVMRDWTTTGLRRSLESYRAALNDEIEARLPKVTCPTVIVRGARDPVVPHAWAEELARRLPRGKLIELPRAAHTVNYTVPDDVARVCLELSRALGVEGHEHGTVSFEAR